MGRTILKHGYTVFCHILMIFDWTTSSRQWVVCDHQGTDFGSLKRKQVWLLACESFDAHSGICSRQNLTIMGYHF